MCRQIYDWKIVNCDVKQPIQLNSTINKMYTKNVLSFQKMQVLKYSTNKKFIKDYNGKYRVLGNS